MSSFAKGARWPEKPVIAGLAAGVGPQAAIEEGSWYIEAGDLAAGHTEAAAVVVAAQGIRYTVAEAVPRGIRWAEVEAGYCRRMAMVGRRIQ